MSRLLLHTGAICAPLAAFVWWMQSVAMEKMAHNAISGIGYMLLGLALLALVEGILIKFWLLPLLARHISERVYAGSYLPEDDPLARLVTEIATHHRRDLLPRLENLVEADPHRERGWLELAHLRETEAADPAGAVDTLLRGADKVQRPTDAALLLWRAITLCERHPALAPRIPHLRETLLQRYPDTPYGRRATSTAPHLQEKCK